MPVPLDIIVRLSNVDILCNRHSVYGVREGLSYPSCTLRAAVDVAEVAQVFDNVLGMDEYAILNERCHEPRCVIVERRVRES